MQNLEEKYKRLYKFTKSLLLATHSPKDFENNFEVQLAEKTIKEFGAEKEIKCTGNNSNGCYMHSCGHISKENRKTQEIFKCVKCGHEDNADFEASLTILKRGQSLVENYEK